LAIKQSIRQPVYLLNKTNTVNIPSGAKIAPFYFCSNFVKLHLILIRFGFHITWKIGNQLKILVNK